MSKIDFTSLQSPLNDAASLMPSIAGKKILMGFWHNWPAGPSDGYQRGQFANMSLVDVPKDYNVVAVAFMKGNEAANWQMGDRASAKRWHEFARTFAREHTNAWVATAAKWLALSDDDFYAKACDLAAETVAAVAKEEL